MIIDELDTRVRKLEQMVYESFIQTQNALASENKQRARMEPQPLGLHSMHLALCVDTLDPLKMGRIRVYTPLLSDPDTARESLPWAAPISAFGGFDDSGSPWVPPAGSKVALLFHGGNRGTPYYIGTVWDRHRGYDSGSSQGRATHTDFWNYAEMDEFNCVWQGKRNGYLDGNNGGDQVLPPWNTESYNGYDNDSVVNFYQDPAQFGNITYPNVFGMKTSEKHAIKFVDGDHKCNLRSKRLEMFSSCGNWLMMKDDHLHPAGQWAFGGAGGNTFCHDTVTQVPKEWPCCNPPQQQSTCGTAGCSTPPSSGCSPNGSTSSTDKSKFTNPFYKRQEEMRPYNGAPTPMNNKCILEQSGIQFQSLSGQQFYMDDSVDQPTGVPTWDRSFDFGCNNLFLGKMGMTSATGHEIKLSDHETVPQIRDEKNGIFLKTALGIRMEMNDHTIPSGGCECPPNFGGPQRGFFVETTASNIFRMSDEHVHQCTTPRLNGGVPKVEDQHKYEGYILLRSGYGLQLLMKDEDIQTETKSQFIEILSPQKDNPRGPHIEVMQEVKSGPGLVLLRAGGVFFTYSTDDNVEVVGDINLPYTANKFLSVRDNMLVDVNKYYFNHADLHLFLAEKVILLLAGHDCPEPGGAASGASAASNAAIAGAVAGIQSNNDNPGPCIWPAIAGMDPWPCPHTGYIHFGVLPGAGGGPPALDSRSDRVFISGKPGSAKGGSSGSSGGSGSSGSGTNTTNFTSAGGPTSSSNFGNIKQ